MSEADGTQAETSRADGRCGRLARPGWRPGGAGRPGNYRLEGDTLGESCEEDAVRCAAAGALEPGRWDFGSAASGGVG